MSILLMSRVFSRPMGGSSRKLLLVRLADFADDMGRGIWPSVERLAAETELSVRTVQRLLSQLVDEGVLVIVRRASGRPGESNRYDFDLDRLFADRDAAQTGDTMSPVEGDETGDIVTETGVTVSQTGDTDGRDGCHHVTRTVIEPLREPSQNEEREGACEREQGGPVSGSVPGGETVQGVEAGDADASSHGPQPDSAATIERLYWRLIKGWPGFEGMPKTAGWKAFCDLSEEDRALALARRDAWIEGLRRNGRKHVPAPQTYCRERLFADVVATPAKAAPVEAAPFGRAWFAARMARLLEPSLPVNTRLTAVQQQQVAAGIETVERIMAERRRREGWPFVTRMDEAARRRRPVAVLPAFEELGACCERVRVGSALWQSWAAHAQRVGWPWFEGCGLPDWVWLPGSGVDGLEPEAEVVAALERFAGLVQAAGLIRERGEHHG